MPYDYTGSCRAVYAGGYFIGCACVAPFKPNSHLESNDCVPDWEEETCTGSCYYHCNDGYVWNPVTATCDLVVVVVPRHRTKMGVAL